MGPLDTYMYILPWLTNTIELEMYTVESLKKEYVGGNINLVVLSLIERLSSLRGSQCIKIIGKKTSSSVFCRVVYHTVSLFWMVHYRRFHCIQVHCMYSYAAKFMKEHFNMYM